MKILMLLVKDIVHVNAIISFAAVSLEIKFTKFLFLVWHNVLVLKLALVPLQEEKKTNKNTKGWVAGKTERVRCSQFCSIDLFL